MKIDIVNAKGEKVGDYSIDDSILEFEKGDQAVHDAVVAHLAERRAGTASTKTRGEVQGSGRKPFKQKGLGRARAGSVRSPIWRHGGRIFGPKPRDFSFKLNAKVKKLALRRSFSERLKDSSVLVLEGFTAPDHKTKNVSSMLKTLKLPSKVLFSVKDYDGNLLKATGNMPDVVLMKASSVNTYQVLDADKLLFTKDALDEFVKRLA